MFTFISKISSKSILLLPKSMWFVPFPFISKLNKIASLVISVYFYVEKMTSNMSNHIREGINFLYLLMEFPFAMNCNLNK